jgi:hypothetical protein
MPRKAGSVSRSTRTMLESHMPGFGAELDKAIVAGDGLEFLASSLASALDFLDTEDRRNTILSAELLIRGLDADPELYVPPWEAPDAT